MLDVDSKQKLLIFFYASFSWNNVRRALLVDERTRLLAKRRTLNQTLILKFLKEHQDGEGKSEASKTEHSNSYEPYVGIPKLNSWARFYMVSSTCWHILNIILNAYLKWYGEETFDTQRSYICYVPRFVFHEGLGQSYMVWLSLVNSLLHMLWRFIIVVLERSITLNMLPYLFWDDKLVREGSDPEKALKDYHSKAGLDLAQNVIFYRSFNGETNDVELHVRPNRTPEARKQLYTFIDKFSAVSAVIVSIATIFTMSIVLRTILLKQNLLYEGCHVVMFDQAYLIRSFLSALNTSILFLDNALIIYLSPGFVAILIFDLTLHWKAIDTRIKTLRNLLPIVREISDQSQKNIISQIERLQLSGRGSRYLKRMHYSGVLNFAQKDIEREIILLRWTIVDFFQQVSQVDKYVSIVVGFAIVLWLSVNGMVTMTGLQIHSNYNTVIIVRGFQVAGFLALTVVSLLFFVIKQLTEDAYITIGTLMAFDPSLNKTRWIVLLEHYTTQPRYAITVYRTNKIYDHLTYLKVVSYTLSFFFFVESYRQ